MQRCHCIGEIEIIAAPSELKKISLRLSLRQFTVSAMAKSRLVICLVELLTGLTGSKSPGLRSCLVTYWKPWWAQYLKQVSWCSNSFSEDPSSMRILSPYTWNSSVVHLKNRINLSSGNPHNNVAIGRSSWPPSWHKDGVKKIWSRHILRTAFEPLFDDYLM